MFNRMVISKETDSRLKSGIDSIYYEVLKKISLICLFVMIAAQTIMLVRFDGEQFSDARVYLNLARECAENGLWYPSKQHISAPYLFGNGLINIFALVLSVVSDLRVLFVLNMLFVQVQLWSCVYIVKKVFSNSTFCFWFIIIFCLLNTFWSEIVQIRTEIPFSAFAFSGLALLYTDKKWLYPIAGVILALANWIRPIALAYMIGALLMMLLKKKKLRNIVSVVSGYIIIILLIGSISLANCGHFVYQSTTFGYNLIMSAHDDADGSYMWVTDEGQVGYIEPEKKSEMIFKDYDEYYTKLSMDWIKENPIDYLKQIPAKIFLLYGTETYSGSAYYNNERDTRGMSYIKTLADKFTGKTDEPFYIADFLIILNQVWYMVICLLFAVGTILLIKKKRWIDMLPLWLIMFCGTGITVLAVGGARYHFPYLPIMMICAAFACEYIFTQRMKKKLK